MAKPAKKKTRLFYSAADEVEHAKYPDDVVCGNPQLCSPAYRLAYTDQDFLLTEEQRPVRLMLELSKPEAVLQALNISQTIVIFGSARTIDEKTAQSRLAQIQACEPVDAALLAKAQVDLRNAQYYEQARELAHMIADRSPSSAMGELHVITGGGPGVMEGANRGAAEAGAKSIGLNIVLPHEQYPNPYITPELCFRFHYFAMRKMHFLMRAKALIVFPGGFGTLDELFEALTLVQTKKIKPLPVLIFGQAFWSKLINFDVLVEQGMISSEDLKLIQFVDTTEQAWAILEAKLAFES